jgi:hypothetical protein
MYLNNYKNLLLKNSKEIFQKFICMKELFLGMQSFYKVTSLAHGIPFTPMNPNYVVVVKHDIDKLLGTCFI